MEPTLHVYFTYYAALVAQDTEVSALGDEDTGYWVSFFLDEVVAAVFTHYVGIVSACLELFKLFYVFLYYRVVFSVEETRVLTVFVTG